MDESKTADYCLLDQNNKKGCPHIQVLGLKPIILIKTKSGIKPPTHYEQM